MSLADTVKQAVTSAIVTLTPDAPPDRLIGKYGAIGTSLPRIDGPRKVRGQARFAAEVPAAAMTYAALAHSAVARGRIASLETGAAEAAPGVVLVMTYKNAPRLAPPAIFLSDPRAAGASSLPIMQDDTIHWNGEPIAIVLAETQEQAEHAKSLVRATYTAEPASLSFAEAATHSHHPDSVMGEPPMLEVGDAEAALAGSAFKIDLSYHTPRHSHAAIEPHAATLWWEGETLVIHDTTQMLHQQRWTMAGIFGIKEDQIRIYSPFVGGGFGGKGLWSHQVLAAAASRLAARPVRVALSRESVFRIAGGRTNTQQRVALGAKPDGTLAALIHTGVVSMTTHNNCPEQFTFPARHLYAADAFKLEQRVADIDMLANTFMRAPGESVGTFALECALDELAEAMALDPLELRRRLEPERDPTSGTAFSSRHVLRAYAMGAEAFGWADRPKTPPFPPRGRVARRHGRRHRHLPLLPHARRRRPPRPAQRRHRDRADGEPRDGHGHRHRAGPGHRRPPRPRRGPGRLRIRRHRAPRRHHRRRLLANGLDRRRRHRREPCAGRGTPQARRQRFPPRRPQARRGRAP